MSIRSFGLLLILLTQLDVCLAGWLDGWLSSGDADQPSLFGAPPGVVYTEAFACADNSAPHPLGLAKLNDGYCDCPSDGSDEPGTAACSQGKFYCEGPHWRAIGTGMLGDGICDCCDGSDEASFGLTECTDTCGELQKAKTAKSRREALARAQGIAAIAKLVPKGAAKRADLLEKHTEERGQLEYIGKALDTIKKEMHDPATPAPRVQHLQHQFMAGKKQGSQVLSRHRRSQRLLQMPSDAFLGLVEDCVVSEAIDEKLIRGGAITAIAKKYSFIVCPFDQVFQRWEDNQKWEHDTCVSEIGADNATGVITANETCTAKFAEANNDEIGPEQAGAIQHFCQEQTSKPEEIQQCINQQVTHHHRQREEKLRTVLGVYNDTLSEPAHQWVFNGYGERCSDGSQRQVNVSLVCGGTDQVSGKAGRLIHVAENGMCQYELKLMTPIACAPQRPKHLNSEL